MWTSNVTANCWINATTTTTGNAYTYTYRPSVWQDNGGYAVTYEPEKYEISPAEIHIDSEQSVERELEPCTEEELEEFLAGE